MTASLLFPLVIVVFLVLLFAGHVKITKGANAQVATGAVLLALSAVIGQLALAALFTIGRW